MTKYKNSASNTLWQIGILRVRCWMKTCNGVLQGILNSSESCRLLQSSKPTSATLVHHGYFVVYFFLCLCRSAQCTHRVHTKKKGENKCQNLNCLRTPCILWVVSTTEEPSQKMVRLPLEKLQPALFDYQLAIFTELFASGDCLFHYFSTLATQFCVYYHSFFILFLLLYYYLFYYIFYIIWWWCSIIIIYYYDDDDVLTK